MEKTKGVKIGILILLLLGSGCATNGGGGNAVDTMDRGLGTVEQTAQSGRQAIEAGTMAAENMGAGQMGLTDMLMSQLGVSQPQALGGAGAIFKAARANMEPQSFTALAQSVPGMGRMLNAAPELSDSVSNMVGDASSMMGDSGGAWGGMASLAAAFKQLNLSPDMVGQFIPVVTNYVKTTGGQAMANLLQSALSAP